MSAIILDGKKVSQKIKDEIKKIIEERFHPKNLRPGLAAIIVGDNPASKVYVNSKARACEEIGIKSKVYQLDKNTSQNELIKLIEELNVDPEIHGILVQQPLPDKINTNLINEIIDPRKDVDGFHPVNLGRLLIGEECFVPCTPLGIIELLTRYDISLEGKNVVVIGRSNIVGKPLAALLMQKNKRTNATVTVCHSATKNIEEFTSKADVVIAAMGKPEFLNSSMIKEKSIVVDVGINQIEDVNSQKGYRIVGDVKFEDVIQKAAYLTPVPGGVGPMTISMLLKNTLIASSKFFGIEINV